MTIEKRIYDGALAREVLDNEAFTQAFADMKAEYAAALFASPARDIEGREKLYLMVKLTEKLEATLTAAMTDGKMASQQREYEAAALARDRASGMQTMYQ